MVSSIVNVVTMVSSIIKWCVKDDELTNEVKEALKTPDISNFSEQHIEIKVTKIFNKRSKSTFTWVNEGRKRAIRSTLREIVREQKTVAIAALLLACNNSKEINQLKNGQGPNDLDNDLNITDQIIAEANKIAEKHGYDEVLSEDLIAYIMKNQSKITDLLNKYKVIYKGGIYTSINKNKAVNKEVERLLHIIPKYEQDKRRKELTNDVKAFLESYNIPDSSKRDIDGIVNDIYNDMVIINATSSSFAGATERAIKSALKEIVREQKTGAIAKLLQSPAIVQLLQSPDLSHTIEQLRNGQASDEQTAETAEIVTVAKELGCDKVLSKAEIAVILENHSTILGLFSKYRVTLRKGIYTNIIANKAVNKEVERKLPPIKPEDKKKDELTEYSKYFRDLASKLEFGKDVSNAELKKTYPELDKTMLLKDFKSNLLNKLSVEEKKLIVKAVSNETLKDHLEPISKNPPLSVHFSSPIRLRVIAEMIVFNQATYESEFLFNEDEQSALRNLAKWMVNGQGMEFRTKARALAIAAEQDKTLLTSFSDNDIQLLNQLFGTQMSLNQPTVATSFEIDLKFMGRTGIHKVKIDNDATVLEVKKLAAEASNVPIESIGNVVHAGQMLRDDQNVLQVAGRNGSMIHIIFKG